MRTCALKVMHCQAAFENFSLTRILTGDMKLAYKVSSLNSILSRVFIFFTTEHH
jgi:hypothetical protein